MVRTTLSPPAPRPLPRASPLTPFPSRAAPHVSIPSAKQGRKEVCSVLVADSTPSSELTSVHPGVSPTGNPWRKGALTPACKYVLMRPLHFPGREEAPHFICEINSVTMIFKTKSYSYPTGMASYEKNGDQRAIQ